MVLATLLKGRLLLHLRDGCTLECSLAGHLVPRIMVIQMMIMVKALGSSVGTATDSVESASQTHSTVNHFKELPPL
jgi:transcriptional antiterminator Rof (Rho-off)